MLSHALEPSGECSAKRWYVAQIGAREHYAVARALYDCGRLARLATDFWAFRQFGLSASCWLFPSVSRRLLDRRINEIPDGCITAFNWSAAAREVMQRLFGQSGWHATIARNRWFRKEAARHLSQRLTPGAIVFAYSYAALDLFEVAKSKGCYTVLGQIDPGIAEEQIVADEVRRYPEYDCGFRPAPIHYWQEWMHECRLADRIIVNSKWSEEGLKAEGVDQSKLRVVPLAYSRSAAAIHFKRQYQTSFTTDRPLRVLFLGQVIARKGIYRLIDAARLLRDEPIRFIIVGEASDALRKRLMAIENIDYIGGVPRNRVNEFYRQSDVFLFPTLSDGFGLTQLEARSWRLPLICSDRCGDVVTDRNGRILRKFDGEEIAMTLREICATPCNLREWSQDIDDLHEFSLERLSQRLVAIENELGVA